MIGPNGEQIEAPDPWLDSANPWEIPRLDTSYTVRMFGQAQRGEGGKGPGKWTGGWQILAVPYDGPSSARVPSLTTQSRSRATASPTWSTTSACGRARPVARLTSTRSCVLASLSWPDACRTVATTVTLCPRPMRPRTSCAALQVPSLTGQTRVLYPNDNTMQGKELRLQQQYFWTAASLQDIIRRFEKLEQPWSEFSQYNAIQLNDTHPTLAILEFMRLLVDEKDVKWDDAWTITQATFGYTYVLGLSVAG